MLYFDKKPSGKSRFQSLSRNSVFFLICSKPMQCYGPLAHINVNDFLTENCPLSLI